jgi:hypothetical protein
VLFLDLAEIWRNNGCGTSGTGFAIWDTAIISRRHKALTTKLGQLGHLAGTKSRNWAKPFVSPVVTRDHSVASQFKRGCCGSIFTTTR